MNSIPFNAGLAYSDYKQRQNAYRMAAMVAFVMSSYFVVGYLAGDLLFWQWDVSQWMNGVVGVGICAVMTRYQFILYAQGDIAGGSKATILAVCVAVGFSMLSEIGQGMERDHVRMETRSIESPTYQAIVNKLGAAGTAASPYPAQLAEAEMKLARCQQNVNAGKWKDCVESTARVQAIQNAIALHYQQNQQQALALATTAKQMEKDESNYHPLVSLIKSSLEITAVVASFLLSLALIAFFEYAFHYLGRQLASTRELLLSNGYDVTRKARKAPRTLANAEIPETRIPDDVTRTNTDHGHPCNTDKNTDTSGPEMATNGADTDQMECLLSEAKKAHVGDEVNCPNCQNKFIKKTYNQTFCKKPCKDEFWNTVSPDRQKFAKGTKPNPYLGTEEEQLSMNLGRGGHGHA